MRAQMEFARSRGGDTGRADDLTEPAAQLLSAAKRLENPRRRPGPGDLSRGARRCHVRRATRRARRAGRVWPRLPALRSAGVPKLHRPIDFLLSGMANRIIGGPSAGSDPMRAALELMCTQPTSDGDSRCAGCRWAWPIVQESAAARTLGRRDLAAMATDVVRRARDAGALAVLPPALVYRAGVHMFAGEFATAATLIEEADSITAATDYAPVRVPLAEPGCVAGDSGRRGRADRGGRGGRNRQG